MTTEVKQQAVQPENQSQSAANPLRKFLGWLLAGDHLVIILTIGFFVILPLLMFYNLGLNPRSWHDEGAALSVSRTLAEDGVYATRSSEGYQTFGPVQSVGPTVLVPVAVAFKIFGVGVAEGRYVAVLYALATALLLYFIAQRLFGRTTALITVILLVSYPAASYFLYGRQVLGDYPGLAFFLAAWLVWSQGVKTGKIGYGVLTGLLLGLSMVTKSHNLIIGGAVLGVMILLDRFYYRQHNFLQLFLAGVTSVAVFGAWFIFQYLYFGADVFSENLHKLGLLAASTTGFSPRLAFMAIRHLTGAGSGYLYMYWGFAAFLYAVYLALRRSREGYLLAFLLLACTFWLAYYVLWIIPWPPYAVAPSAVIALFVGKLCADLITAVRILWRQARGENSPQPDGQTLSARNMVVLGTLVGLTTLLLFTGYSFYNIVQADVLDRYGAEESQLRSPRQFEVPYQLAAYLKENVPQQDVIDTWEREMGILTSNRYHYPDQSLLIQTHAANYRGGARNYALSKAYFDQVKPAYVIVGWWARSNSIYDIDYLSKHSNLVATFGSGDWRYDLYQLNQQ